MEHLNNTESQTHSLSDQTSKVWQVSLFSKLLKPNFH
jgi:hypothetical protein